MSMRGHYGGKREWLARGLFRSGATFLFGQLPQKDLLLVLNYHRIGNRDEEKFGRGVFSATADALNEQISYLKRNVSLVTLDEALAFSDGTLRDRSRRCRVLITFDDGYIDNYQLAYPILRSHGVQGVFFLTTGLVGSCDVPWWDHIAYLMSTGSQRRFHLHYPAELAVNIDKSGRETSLRDVLRLYKRPDNTNPARFIGELREATRGEDPPEGLRRFLSWSEAGEMVRGGMAVGSHTHSHQVLSQLSEDEQRQELLQSRTFLRERLGIDADALAYPVGAVTSFSEQTQKLTREVGYRAAFSFYGGTNLRGKSRRYDLKRASVDDQSWHRFCTRVATCRLTGNYWP